MYIKVSDDGIIEDVKFNTFGCASAIASSSMATEMIKGQPIDKALELTNKAVVEALDGLPPVKIHCSVLAEEAVKAAVKDYYDKKGIEYDPAEFAGIQREIIKLKKEKDICILAHCYQSPEILEVADFVGDSFALSVEASKVNNKTVIMCGVRFMAETVKILSPDKTVYLANPDAGCPMAEMMDKEVISLVKEQYPDYTVVAYINTTSELKTICDVCVTSSSALKICKQIENKNILFIPDCNLGDWISKQLPEKNFKLLSGGCPTHARMGERDVKRAREAHPDALLLIHPECVPDVVKHADYVGSTTGIMNYAKESDAKEFIIGTENSIVTHLQMSCPDKMFYPLSKDCVCHNMKATTLVDVLNCCKGIFGEEITLDEETYIGAKKCIDEMIRLG